ncbi:hypothetical protein O181_026852 [Austropuccinia psidii MF-1]|uniref:Uncharacterized protein n=1 Tax=Austropuccinia psidii MF-1 TaxID=1389203 RepID=A0A9Q3H155_9BASI|nr:hypothetical protein [Austropuccinia psidii MF-1]
MPPTPPSHQSDPQPCLPSLRSCSALKMRLQCCPHHSLPFHTPTSSSLPLTVLTLPCCPQDMPPTPPSHLPNPLCRLPC